MSSVWGRAVGWLLCIAVFVYAPVRVFHGPQWSLAAVGGSLLLLLGWHLYQLGRLIRWLRGPLDAPLPVSRGVWDIAFAGLHRRVRIRTGQQQVLSDTLESFTQAAQALPDGIIAFNRHRQIIWINARAEGHFQLSAETDGGQVLTNLIRHPDFVAYLDVGRYEEPLVFHSDRVDGQTLLLQVIPYGNDQNLLLSRDISQLERLETMRRDFIANVSHELKTPLTVVAGFAEMLADDYAAYAEAEVKHYLGLICEQSARMQRLIEDLLTLSALETGGSGQAEERVELEPLLRSIVAEAEALSGGRHEITLSINGPACISGSANELRSAFGNLASNAVRYTPAGGHIGLSWRVRSGNGGSAGSAGSGACGEFAVSDSGIGIAPQHLPRLTERFYRVDRSRSRETGGTGLGLAIVKHVLTRHQAVLDVHSEPGKGSTFIARFPSRRLLG
ncbi:MAG: phosphate regulon sensor histidine kinase PhoR [Candidatus Accumulibacter sp.]|nr:phosphate regulon sensor histidine kinase PhoR [Accumulibacter sp.]